MLKTLIGHSTWLMVERILRIGFAVIVGAWVARSLGPSSYGVLIFASQFVAMCGPLTSIGLDALQMQWLINCPHDRAKIISTITVIRLATSTVGIAGLYFLAPLFFSEQTTAAIIIIALTFLAAAPSVFETYFLSLSRGAVFFRAYLSGSIVSNVARLAFIFYSPSVEAFAACLVLERSSIALLFVLSYLRDKDCPGLAKPSASLALSLIREGFPTIFQRFAALAFLSADIIILKWVAGDAEVGIYAAATRITEAWVTLQSTLVLAVAPVIIGATLSNTDDSAHKNIGLVFEVVTLLSLTAACFISLLAYPLIQLLYGTDFQASAAILIIHFWSLLFAGWRLLSSRWMQAQGLQWLLVRRSLLGAITVVLLAWVFGQEYGAMGVAIGSLIGHVVAGLVSDLLSPSTRQHFRSKTGALKFSLLRQAFGIFWTTRRNPK